MSIGKRLPLALGGLGATVLLGIGASFAIGGEQSSDRSGPRPAPRRAGRRT